jgi:hydroxypyruvate isomerase
MLNRREFLEIGSAATVLTAVAGPYCTRRASSRFNRDYAPQPAMFRHHAGVDPVDQIAFLADEGFRSIEDTGLRAKPTALQEKMGRALARRGLALACFTGVADFGRPIFASGRRDLQFEVLRELRHAIDTATRVGGRALSIVAGQGDAILARQQQEWHAIELIHRCADLCEPRGITLLLEPIEHGPGHSRMFLRSAREAVALCRAVARSSCRVLLDIYQQVAAGEDVLRLLTDVGDVLGHVQLGDFPGRKEPGTGELDFSRLLATLDAIDYRRALGMEHGFSMSGKAGERAAIEAYVALDYCTHRPSA